MFLTSVCAGVLLLSGRAHGADSRPASAPPLPAAFVSATNLLFEDGMSDPRGGKYREITIKSRRPWFANGVVVTHGWILTSNSSTDCARAVTWNGVTCDIVKDGGPADIAADIAALLRAHASGKLLDSPELLRIFAPDKDFLVNWSPVEFTAASMLLRMGSADLAKQCYAAANSNSRQDSDVSYQSHADPFLKIGDNWVSSIYDRSVAEFVDGHDQVAANDSELILRLSRQIKVQAESHGARVSPAVNPRELAHAYFDFVTAATYILADSKRRLAAARFDGSIATLVSAHSAGNERITLLVGHLDDTRIGGQMIPGSVSFDSDSVVEAVVKEGDAAIGPLLEAMEHDRRLTRFASRERRRDRYFPESVRYAAYFCITRILQTEDFGGSGRASIADIRAYWKANRSIPVADRWFRTLADDSATPDQWLAAARNIVAPPDFIEHSMWGGQARRHYGIVRQAMQGESLRVKTAPSVSDLLVRRASEFAGPMQISPEDKRPIDAASGRFEDSVTMALDLAAWDLKASLPLLKNAARLALDVAQSGDEYAAARVAEVTVARLSAGDTGAAPAYVVFISHVRTAGSALAEPDLFAPFYEFPADSTLTREANALFDGASSPFNPIVRPTSFSAKDDQGYPEVIGSPLLCVPAFRRQALRELDDQRPAGDWQLTIDSQISWSVGNSGGDYAPGSPLDLKKNPVGIKCIFRLCDLYAWEIAPVCARLARPSKSTALKFELQWPLAKRDAAIAQIKQSLRDESPLLQAADFH